MPGSGLHRQLKIQWHGRQLAVNIWQTGRVHVQGKGAGRFAWLLSLAHASSLDPEATLSTPPFASSSLSSDSASFCESDSPGQVGSFYFSAREQVLKALIFVFPFFAFLLESAASLLGAVAGRFASSLSLLAATLLGLLSVRAIQWLEPIQAQAHPRKRITSRVTPRCKVPPFSPRFQGVLLFQGFRGHSVFPVAPFKHSLCFSDQVPIRAAALPSYDSLRLTRFDSALVAGLVAFTPSAGSGAFLCRFLVLCT